VTAIGAPELNDFFIYLKRVRGHHMARAAIATISAAWTWGRTSTAWRLGDNPRHAIEMPQPDPRVVIYTDAELRAFIDTADNEGRHSIGDAIVLGLYTGQRQSDRLALEDCGLIDGRRQFRQSKTGALVAIPEAPRLAERLVQAKVRVARMKLELGLRDLPPTIVVDEKTGRPYNGVTYRHEFSDLRAIAAKQCPSLASKRDQDLRDTAVTWLARAGATLPEIASITGHSLRSIHNILKHYLAITPELADAGIAKLVAWMSKEGMAV
jgi:integrase